MSNWTHVNGVFRIDKTSLKSDMNFSKIFGEVCSDEDLINFICDPQKCPDGFLPFGSEGACDMSVWTNPDKCCAVAHTVSIFGDLRDHDSTEKVIDWFVEVCNNLERYLIRQAVITVTNEWSGKTQTATLINDKICIVDFDKCGTITNIQEVISR